MSDSYRALNRVYRPKSFDEIVSQGHVSSTLMNAIKQNRLSHAYMFCGPRGVGKTTMARVLARKINGVDDAVDGEQLNQTLNIVEIDAASHNKVEDIHQLRDSVRIPPQNGRYKIFIIDEVHMLSKAAFNALLKTLEEPPAHAIFIFATTEPHKVLPTILSRVQRFDFRRISTSEIREQLKRIAATEGITIDEESLQLISQKADGALRDALGLMDQAIAFCGKEISYKTLLGALHAIDIDQLFELTDIVVGKRKSEGLTKIDELLRAGTDIQEFLVSWMQHLRNLYVARVSAGEHLLEATPETRARYSETAAPLAPEDLLRMMHLVNECQIRIREAQQPRIQLELLFLKLLHMTPAADLAHLRNTLEEVKKKPLNRPEAPSSEGAEADIQKEEGLGAMQYASAVQHTSAESKVEDEATGVDQSSAENSPVEPQGVAPNAGSTEGVSSESALTESASQPEPNKPRVNPNIPSLSPPSLGLDPELDVPLKALQNPASASGGSPDRSVQSRQSGPSSTPAPLAAPPAASMAGHHQAGTTTSAPPHPFDTAPPATPPSQAAQRLDIVSSVQSPSATSPQPVAERGSAFFSSFQTGSSSASHTAEPPQSLPEEPPLTLQLISTVWPEVLERMDEAAPKFLMAQLRRVDLKEVKRGNTLNIAVENEFAARMVEEQRSKLQLHLKDLTQRSVVITISIEKPSVEHRTVLNPYDEFKEVQKRDPMVGKIVEVFGAELQY